MGYSQNKNQFRKGDTIYYSWKENMTTKENAKKLAHILDVVTYEGRPLYKVEMFKLDTISDTYYKVESLNTTYMESLSRQGKNITYWRNGNKSAEGMMKKSRRVGFWEAWYEDGTKMSEREYFEQKKLLKKKTKPSKLLNFWNRKGEQTLKDGTGEYFYENKNGSEHKGSMANYEKQGIWIGFRKDGSRMYKETYKNGKLKKGESWDKKGKKYNYKEVFVNTTYSGGMDGIRRMIVRNFRTPKYAIENGIGGVMLVTFTVDKKGKVKDIEVKRKLCEPCDNEAIRLVRMLKKWKPAKHRGQNVNVKYTLPLRIDIQ